MLAKSSLRSSSRAARLSAVTFAAFVVASMVLVAAPLRAASYSWAVAAGDWSVASNWGGTLLPTSSDTVYVVNGGTVNVVIAFADVCNTLYLDGGALQMTASGALETTLAEYVGCSGTGTFTQFGGVNQMNANNYGGLTLGYNPGSSGTYGLGGGGLLSAFTEIVGNSGTGTFTQSGGTNSVSAEFALYLAYNSGSNGTYGLSGNGLLSANTEIVGNSGTGAFTQSGGTNSIGYSGYLSLGENPGSSGTYNLSGDGQLVSSSTEYVGYSGTGSFTQTGGTNSIGSDYLYIGRLEGSSGTYSLSSGLLSAPAEYVGIGTFAQSGGTNSIGAGSLYIGGSGAAYNLSGTGNLSAGSEYVGSSGTGTFTQSGGANSVSLLSISNSGSYTLAGGTLQVSGNLVNQGSFSGGSTPASLGASGILDLTSGTWQNLAATSLSMGANSLLIVPAGFNPSTGFAHYTTLGMTHTAGSPLIVPAGQGFAGSGSISDQVICQGTILSGVGGAINLNNGLILSGSGTISLGSTGSFTANDTTSSISSGSLSAGYQYVGKGGSGLFTQTGGTNALARNLYLAYGPADSGSYVLGGSGRLLATYEYIGCSGTGVVTQTGGVNNGSDLELGYDSGSGTYNLSGSGQLSGVSLDVGVYGTGTFNQSGGNCSLAYGFTIAGNGTYNLSGTGHVSTSAADLLGAGGRGSFIQSGGFYNSESLTIGLNVGDTGVYSLSNSGHFSAPFLYVGEHGTGTFTQSGGTANVSKTLCLCYFSGSSGTYSLGATAVLSASNEYVGYSAPAVALFQQSGGSNAATNLNIGSGGCYQLTGGTLRVAGGLINAGVFDLNEGLLNVSALSGGGGTAAFNFSGGTLRASSAFSSSLSMTLGTSGGGATFDTAGYAVTLSGPLFGPGSLTKVDSGTLSLATSNNYSGGTTINGGTLQVANAGALGSGWLAINAGMLDLDSLSIGVPSLTGTGGAIGDLSNRGAGTTTLSVNQSANTTFGGAVQNGTQKLLALNKNGAGTLTLSGSNTYSGPTTITLGKLTVDGWLTNSAVSVNGGTLGGTGYLNSVTVNAGGNLAPGDPQGVLHLSGNLVLAAGAGMDYDLDGVSTDDEVSMPSGTLTFSGQQFSNFGFAWTDWLRSGHLYAGQRPVDHWPGEQPQRLDRWSAGNAFCAKRVPHAHRRAGAFDLRVARRRRYGADWLGVASADKKGSDLFKEKRGSSDRSVRGPINRNPEGS